VASSPGSIAEANTFATPGRVLTQCVGVDPERDSWVRMTETFGDHMHRHASQQQVRSVNVSQTEVAGRIC
jgi:hypothetical protein